MKRMQAAATVLAMVSLAAAGNPEPKISYFKNMRQVTISAADRQNFLVIDSPIWSHARSDLADLRLYDGTTQFPYQLTSEVAVTSAHEVEVRILNLARHGDHTEFDLDVSAVPEYNRIHLFLDRKDFVATASVSGRNQLTGTDAAPWPTSSTLFDFSREHLGSNSMITLPAWNFRFVHVRLSPGILPTEVERAAVTLLQEKNAAWTDAGSCHAGQEQKRSTLVSCDISPQMPVDRIRFDVSAARTNFRRSVSVANQKGTQIAAGSISRLRMNRGGTSVVSEDLVVNVSSERSGGLTITVDNGDDPPLAFDRIQPQALERRLYFDPQGKTSITLYYGDPNLVAPVYDYAKFFQEDASAAQAHIGTEFQNATYTGRPDDRPWSERHQAILWVLMIVAIAVLTLLAVRGLASGAVTRR